MRRDIALLLQSGQDATARIRVIFCLNFYFDGCRLTFVDICVLGFSLWSWNMLEYVTINSPFPISLSFGRNGSLSYRKVLGVESVLSFIVVLTLCY